MPKVGKKHFKYDEAGKAAAKIHAKKTGQPVEYQAGGAVSVPKETPAVPMPNVDMKVGFKNPMLSDTNLMMPESVIPEDLQEFVGGGMVDAMYRSQNYQVGGEVKAEKEEKK